MRKYMRYSITRNFKTINHFNIFFKFILLFLFIIAQRSFAQEAAGNEESEGMENRHFISLSFGYTYVREGGSLESTEAEGIFVPSIGLDYFYRLKPRWEIGTMMDVELDHYLVVNKELERETAFIATVVGLYKICPYLSIYAGGGIEIEHHQNLAVFRAGIDSPIPIGRGWVLAPTLIFDFKEGYDTWSLAIAIGKEF